MTWQPIETAPKDGRRILLWWPGSGMEQDKVYDPRWIAWWDKTDGWHGPYSDGHDTAIRNCVHNHNGPTLWAPLLDRPVGDSLPQSYKQKLRPLDEITIDDFGGDRDAFDAWRKAHSSDPSGVSRDGERE